MKFRILYLVGFFFITIATTLDAQQYAGEKKEACSKTGAVIGLDNPNSNYCYIWEIADGLDASQINSTNPLVTPNNTTIYRCTVTDQNFSFKAIDQVEVKVVFGGISFQPTYIKPDGEINQSLATLSENENFSGGSGGSFTWSIENDPDNTGCAINPQSGWISNCNAGGKVTITATRDNNTACKAEKVIEVNVGVKDVTAKDVARPGRIAHAGDTLYVTTAGPIEFEAISNEGATFPEGQPEWSGDLTATAQYVWSTNLSGPGIYKVVAAGDKEVFVHYQLPDPTSFGVAFDFSNLQRLKAVLERLNPAGDFTNPACDPIPIGVTLPTNITISRAGENVPKYNNPDLGLKVSYTLTAPAIGVAGCVPLPCCFVTGGIPGIGNANAFAFAKGSAGLGFAFSLTKDPSTANGDDYTGIASINGAVSIGLGAMVDVTLGPVGLAAVVDINTSAKAEAKLVENGVDYQLSWGGLQGSFTPIIYYGDMSNTFPFPVMGPYNIIQGEKTPWKRLYTFD